MSNQFYLAFLKRNFFALKSLKPNSSSLSAVPNICVDTALEEGDEDMFKFLVNEFKCEPSLYAKQMANINGHHELITWIETMNVPLRNSIGIDKVHFKPKNANKWDDTIPPEYRF